MKPKKAYFLADCLLALGVTLLGTGAILSIHRATLRARYDHQLRQRAWCLLSQAPNWTPDETALAWQRSFDFLGDPVTEGGVFRLQASGDISGNRRHVTYEVVYFDGSNVKRTIELEHDFLEADHAGI